ncbi:MAG: nitrate/nitrite transporter NrtS [Pseudomonadota bacterium]
MAAGFLAIAQRRDVQLRALRISLIVGTLLGIINHGNAVLTGSFALTNLIQILLTYLVPYCVSVFSSVSALR